jgi:hypothetical protein
MNKIGMGLISVVALAVALAVPAIVSAGGTTLEATLTGAQEVPAGSGAPKGEGKASVDLRPKRKRVCYELSFKSIAGKATSSGIFKGKKGEDGKTKVVFFNTAKTSPVSGCVKGVSKKLIRTIKRKPRQFHVNVESRKYPNGAIRGQLTRG